MPREEPEPELLIHLTLGVGSAGGDALSHTEGTGLEH
jgi:hypothetical protein